MSQLAADGEAQAGAAVLARRAGVGLLEGFEDDPLLLGGNADAGVGDRELDHLLGLRQHRVIGRPAEHRRPDVQAHAALRRELHGVRQQVLDDLHEALGVGDHGAAQPRIEIRGEREMARLGLVAEVALDGLAQLRERQLFALDRDRARLDLGQVEDVADEIQQVGAGAVDGLGEFHLACR